MIRIHEFLASGELPNCSRLAGVFEVSYKTVQRDIDFMRDQLQLPIDYDQAHHGFRYTRPVAQFPLVSVSQGELVALLVAQKAVEQYSGTPFEKPLRAALDKLATSLDSETSVSLQDLAKAVSFRPGSLPAHTLSVFKNLAEALNATRVVEFEYFALGQADPARRRVEPFHLTCIDNQWYLIGRDQLKNARRTFALARIRRVKVLRQRFAKPTGFSAVKMLADSFSAFEATNPQTVRLRFEGSAARIVSERQWHKSQKVSARPGGAVELTMRVGVAPDLEKWILGWGPEAEVLEPGTLRKRIAERLAQAAARYR